MLTCFCASACQASRVHPRKHPARTKLAFKRVDSRVSIRDEADTGQQRQSAGHATMATQHVVSQRNQEATCFVGSLADEVDDELLWELFTQVGAVVDVSMPKDAVTGEHRVSRPVGLARASRSPKGGSLPRTQMAHSPSRSGG